MKRLLSSRVRAKKEAGQWLALNTEKHESRIEHYLDLANIALSVKKQSKPSLPEEQRLRSSKIQTNRLA
jgi:hypothetical protein